MKKRIIVALVAIMSMCSITFVSMEKVQAAENVVEMQGAGDGHCTVCKSHNGRYRCPAFCPISGARPTDCKCGHAKSSHARR